MASLNDFQEQLDILSTTKTSIKESIISKGQDVSSEDSFSSYADKIDDIVTLEEGTADANARVKDIALGKTAYVTGNKLTGTLRDLRTSGSSIEESELDIPYKQGTSGDSVLFHLSLHKDLGYGVPDVDTIINENTRIQYTLAGSEIANLVGLTGADIRKGATRFGVAGTYTSDANATADDICGGKTAYVNGQKISGNIPIHPADTESGFSPSNVEYLPNGSGFLKYTAKCTDAVNLHGNYQVGAYISISSQASAVRNAVGLTANKLKAGESVLGITGTYTSDANATADDICQNKTAYVNGVKLTGTIHTLNSEDNFNIEASTDINIDGQIISGKGRIMYNSAYTSVPYKISGTTFVPIKFPVSSIVSIGNITADKIKQGETILGVQGSVVELNGETKSVTPTTSSQTIVPTGTGKNALTEVTVSAVTSAIDQNIVASNIKNGVTILGVTGTYITPMKEYASETAMNNDIANIQEGEVVKVVASGVTTYYVKESGIGYQSLDLSSLSVGDTISLKGMKINKTAISHVIQGAGDMATLQFTNNDVNVLKIYFSAGRTAVSGYVTIDEDTYNYANTTEGNPSSLSDADVETINNSNIWNSDTLLTVAINDTTITDKYIEDAILEPTTIYSMKKLVKEEDTISPSDYEEAEEQIGDLFGEEESE